MQGMKNLMFETEMSIQTTQSATALATNITESEGESAHRQARQEETHKQRGLVVTIGEGWTQSADVTTKQG
eukprot:588219-Prorocentrum_lima.AAC.1